MDFYAFAVTAIPILWAAGRLAQPHRALQRWQTAAWLLFKVVLIGGEVSAAITLSKGHDTPAGAWLTVASLIAGGLVVVVPPIARDLARLGWSDQSRRWVGLGLAIVVGWVSLRFA